MTTKRYSNSEATTNYAVKGMKTYAQIPKVNGSLHYLIVALLVVFDLKCCCQQRSANKTKNDKNEIEVSWIKANCYLHTKKS